jgi:hypothetical protein
MTFTSLPLALTATRNASILSNSLGIAIPRSSFLGMFTSTLGPATNQVFSEQIAACFDQCISKLVTGIRHQLQRGRSGPTVSSPPDSPPPLPRQPADPYYGSRKFKP